MHVCAAPKLIRTFHIAANAGRAIAVPRSPSRCRTPHPPWLISALAARPAPGMWAKLVSLELWARGASHSGWRFPWRIKCGGCTQPGRVRPDAASALHDAAVTYPRHLIGESDIGREFTRTPLACIDRMRCDPPRSGGIAGMPLEHVQPGVLLPIAERRSAGQNLRKLVPRSLHATWTPSADREDPVKRIIETDRHRISHLLPIRYDRMRASPLSYLRGTAAVMAADLATTPASGLWVQSCGDCHLNNFGAFASPEGTAVFDVNDFDETLPAPFEWDLKRLATSFALAGRALGMTTKACRHLARTAMQAYRLNMTDLVPLEPLAAWRTRVDVGQVVAGLPDEKLREREQRRLAAITDAGRRGYPKLVEKRRGAWRIRERPPLVFSLTEQGDDSHEMAARSAFESYKITMPEERRLLLDRYRLVDVAFKVVGVGSVGTFCAIALLATPNDATLLLQIKEARASVLAPYAGPSIYANQGQRVVIGQRIMQTTPDLFLGWTMDPGDDQRCYVRRFRDGRLAMISAELSDAGLAHHAILCGATLARAHARSGDAARIAGYMGSGGVFDAAIADFAIAYMTQTERDWRLFVDAIKAGRIEARPP